MAPWRGTYTSTSVRGRRMHNRLRRRRAMRLIALLFVCGGLLTGIWYGTRAQAVTITTVAVSGGTTIDLRAVEQKAQSLLEGNYFFLIPKRFSYTYPHDVITETLERLPRVAHATVARASPTALSVALVEYTPYALWCRDVVPSNAYSQCFFISEEGFAFAEAPSLTGSTFLRYITEGRDPEVGATLASDEYVKKTKEFAQALMPRHDMYVYAITQTTDGDTRYSARGGGELLVTKNADMQEVFENLDAILMSEEFKHLKSGNFVYIDLRFGNKAFVKEFESEVTTVETGGDEQQHQATTTESME